MCEQNILGSEYVELIESCTAQRCGLHKSSPLKTLWSHVLSATLWLTFTFPTVREEIEKRICHQFSLLAFFQTVWPQQIVQPPSCLRGRVQTAAGGKEEINIHLFSPRSLFHPVGMGDLWMFRSFGVHFYSLPWWEDHRDTGKVVQVSHCWLNRHKRKSSGSLEEAREEDGRTGISLRLLACSEISFSTVRAHWGLHGKSASSLGSSMKDVFWHTLKSLFQAEILTSLIFTLCFNVAYRARKSDGEYGERNYRGFCLLFVVF